MDINKDIAKELLDTLTSAKGFVLEQAPDVVQQLLHWQFWSHTFIGIAFLLLALSGVVLVGLMYSAFNEKDCSYSRQESAIGFMLLGGGMFLVGLVVACIQAYIVLQVIVAPKIYLIEYLTGLLK